MKKNYLLAICFAFIGLMKLSAQDTLVYESFNDQAFFDAMVADQNPPPGNPTDAIWYSYDGDGFVDGSGATTPRPDGWYQVVPFSNEDLNVDPNNMAIAANSWFDVPNAAANWLITPSYTLRAHDTLFWKSAPYQTPRYMDGYQVRISTTTNFDFAFNTTLFTAAEMTAKPAIEDTVYSNFTFAPAGAFVHGLDGTYIDPVDQAATHLLHNGRLQPQFVPLDAYSGQTIFIAFYHNSFDDNLIAIDDFMIRGEAGPLGITENSTTLSLNVFPNPSEDMAQVNYTLPLETTVTISIYDVTGKLIVSENKGSQGAGRHFSAINTASMANGFYTVSVQTNNGISTSKLIVK